MNLEQLERIAAAPVSPPPPRREPRPPKDGRVRIQELLDALTEELVWRAYDLLLKGDVLGRKADHDVSLEFATSRRWIPSGRIWRVLETRGGTKWL